MKRKPAYDAAMTDSALLTRLYSPEALKKGEKAALEGPQAHKLRAVLRAQIGDQVALFNARDGEWRCRISALSKVSGEVEVLEQLRAPAPEPGPWLAFAPLKKAALDVLVEKAVELGAEKLIPVLTSRTENRHLKLERLQAQVRDAAEQCERLSLPEIADPVALSTLPSVWPEGRALLVAAERTASPALPEALEGLSGPFGVLIGPEGGFSAAELDEVLKWPISKPVALGPRILRAETAAVAALSVLQALKGDWA